MSLVDAGRLERAYQTARSALLAERTPEGHWVGELSASALSTATAVSALALVQKATAAHGSFDSLIANGLSWLASNQNSDGGWGDTVKSLSNISTTMLCRAAFHLTGTALPPHPQPLSPTAGARGEREPPHPQPLSPEAGARGERKPPHPHPLSPKAGARGERGARAYQDCMARAESWLHERYGRTPEELAEAVRARYGKDRTFSVPILMTSALAGLVSWREVPPLPFELACFPQSWFRFLRLPVVSYALPALIAIGQAVFHHRVPRNPLTRLVRRAAIPRSLRVLQAIQPSSGGFLEATPLTSFVTLGLASTGQAEHPVVSKSVEFIVRSVRPDGSWPIDTNLSTWVTTLAINALATAGELGNLDKRSEVRDWLLRQQYRERHPYTGADPGGWAWTPLPGGVPDGDDTPGALLALRHLPDDTPHSPIDDFIRGTVGTIKLNDAENRFSAYRFRGWDHPGFHVLCGLSWLLALQNRDGGWPTFCRGWGQLPFDRSGTDLTGHALRALAAWREHIIGSRVASTFTEAFAARVVVDGIRVSFPSQLDIDRATRKGLAHLARTQRPDGSWLPLWFGNQHAPGDENPTYGTARVLAAYRDLAMMTSEPARRGVAWLLSNQNADGGWGGGAALASSVSTPSSVEETALAVEVLLDAGPEAAPAVNKGLGWLVQHVEAGGLDHPTPIGFYFAKLWYFEKLYPILFTVAALGRALQQDRPHQS